MLNLLVLASHLTLPFQIFFKFAEIVVCAISHFRSLGRPGKLPPVIFALGVYRPGYLPQEGHRLTQFPDPGPTRSRISFLMFSRAFSTLRFTVRYESSLKTSITR